MDLGYPILLLITVIHFTVSTTGSGTAWCNVKAFVTHGHGSLTSHAHGASGAAVNSTFVTNIERDQAGR